MNLIAQQLLMMGVNSGGGDLLGLLQSYGAFMLFPHAEPSGTVVDNIGTGPDGLYVPSVSLGNPPLYAGGGTSMQLESNTATAKYPSNAIPEMPLGMTLGVLMRIASFSGNRYLINRDDAGFGGGRYWQFRVQGGSVNFIKIRGSIQEVVRPHSVAAGEVIFAIFTFDNTALPFRQGKIYVNGAQSGAAADMGTVNYGGEGGGPCAITVGNFDGFGDGKSGDRFSTSFMIDRPLSEEEVMALYSSVTLT